MIKAATFICEALSNLDLSWNTVLIGLFEALQMAIITYLAMSIPYFIYIIYCLSLYNLEILDSSILYDELEKLDDINQNCLQYSHCTVFDYLKVMYKMTLIVQK